MRTKNNETLVQRPSTHLTAAHVAACARAHAVRTPRTIGACGLFHYAGLACPAPTCSTGAK